MNQQQELFRQFVNKIPEDKRDETEEKLNKLCAESNFEQDER